MNADLEEQLKEMGPAYLSVVTRLKSARTVEPCGFHAETGEAVGCRKGPSVVWLVWPRRSRLVAALLLLLGLSAAFLLQYSSRSPIPRSPFPVTEGPREYVLASRESAEAIAEIVATQKPDGSWQNDFLTRRNAAALARWEGREARIAYKKAMRNLRSRGIL